MHTSVKVVFKPVFTLTLLIRGFTVLEGREDTYHLDVPVPVGTGHCLYLNSSHAAVGG